MKKCQLLQLRQIRMTKRCRASLRLILWRKRAHIRSNSSQRSHYQRWISVESLIECKSVQKLIPLNRIKMRRQPVWVKREHTESWKDGESKTTLNQNRSRIENVAHTSVIRTHRVVLILISKSVIIQRVYLISARILLRLISTRTRASRLSSSTLDFCRKPVLPLT